MFAGTAHTDVSGASRSKTGVHAALGNRRNGNHKREIARNSLATDLPDNLSKRNRERENSRRRAHAEHEAHLSHERRIHEAPGDNGERKRVERRRAETRIASNHERNGHECGSQQAGLRAHCSHVHGDPRSPRQNPRFAAHAHGNQWQRDKSIGQSNICTRGSNEMREPGGRHIVLHLSGKARRVSEGHAHDERCFIGRQKRGG